LFVERSRESRLTSSHRQALLAFLKLTDVGVIALAFATAAFAQLHAFGAAPIASVPLLDVQIEVKQAAGLAAFFAYCHLVARRLGLYRSYRLSSLFREWRDLAGVTFAVAVPGYAAARLLGFGFATPSFLLEFGALTFAGLALERRFFRIVARSARRHGHNLRNVVVIGCDEGGHELAARLTRHADLGYAVEAVFDVGQEEAAVVLEQVAKLLETRPIDEMFLSLPLEAHQELIRGVVDVCDEQGVTVRVLSSLLDRIVSRAQIDEMDGRPIVSIFSGPPDSLLLAVKRLLDVTVSALVLALATPVLLLLALVIKLDSRGPALFVQERVGLGGRRFHFYKFRTMVVDAESRQADLEHLNEAKGAVFKIKHDPRVTRVGRVIRSLSLDELPQLLNVLKGDMSLVGPRPLPVRDVLRIGNRAHRRRFSVKPGITCLWQVGGREPDFEAWIKTDMEYIDNWSLSLDLKILARTIPAVLTGRGAY
jgi:exopolysaccharide biosynthesis polyprenyl glycosylphosphotransferase